MTFVIAPFYKILNYFSSIYLLRHFGRVMTQLRLRPLPLRRAESNPMGSTREIQVVFGVLRPFTVSTVLRRSILIHSSTTNTHSPSFFFLILVTDSVVKQHAYKLQHFVLTKIQ